MLLRDYTLPEINHFIENCNFTESELQYFKLKSKDWSNIKISIEMNISDGSSYARNNRNRNSNDYYRTSYDGRMGMDGDGDGRYSERRYSRARYSRADEREMMLSKLERMMDDANSEAERQTIRDCIRKIESEG